MKKIFLIGGAPTTGKSTLAEGLSKKLNLPWISTDHIRTIMRVTAERERYPDLFLPEGQETAEAFLGSFEADYIAKLELMQAEATWPGVKKIIDEDYTWVNGFIIEGVNITPDLVGRDYKDNLSIQAVFVVDHNEERIREVIFNRGLFDDSNKYPDQYKQKEVEWVKIYTREIEEQAKRNGFPIVECEKNEKDLERILRAFNV